MPEVKYQILRADVAGTPAIPGYVYTDPAIAAADARILSKQRGEKLMVKPITNPEWRKREQRRMRAGEYRAMPWQYENWWCSDAAHAIWKDHFPHPSIERPGFLAYTKSEEDGTIDKQTIVRPGAYLKKYFSTILHRHGVAERRAVDQFMVAYGPLEVKFAKTEEEIITLYENGFETCMQGKEWPHDGRNPAYIYAAGDLQVAYLGDLDDCSARALVWPDKKLHSRIYGDIARLTQGLQRLGYKWGAPIGARVKKVQLKEVKFDPRMGQPHSCFVAPYIDKRNERGGGHLGIIDKGDHMMICHEGEPGSHHCGLPEGLTRFYVPREDEHPTFTCDNCDTPGFKVLTTVLMDSEGEEEESWCNRCLKHDAFNCRYSGAWYCSENVNQVEVDGQLWNEHYANMYAEKCEMTWKLCHADGLILIHFDDGAKKVCRKWIEDNGGSFTSALTRRYYLKKDLEKVCSNEFGSVYAAKCELKHHAFQCDGCESYYRIGERHQSMDNDKLFCPNCDRDKRNPKLPLNIPWM